MLLAKQTQPTNWSETRPITFSSVLCSVLLKTFSQLILQRAGDACNPNPRQATVHGAAKATKASSSS